MKKVRKIRKAYALDLEFIVQYYFPIAQVRTYNKWGNNEGEVLNVGFLVQRSAHGKVNLRRGGIKPHIKYITCSTIRWHQEDQDYYTLEKRFRALLNPVRDKACLEFV